MAAGASRRFVPLSYEIPKGLLKVCGEVLIERQIKQLQQAGIDDVTVVVGYMKEKFYYLKEKYGVQIIENPEYYCCNNTSSLMCVLDKISDTYICSSDNYFLENVFRKEEPHAYYSAVYADGETQEYCILSDSLGIIIDVNIGGKDAWYMLGHAFFSAEFSTRFKEILIREYQNEETKQHLWEDLYLRYIDDLKLHIQKYDRGVIFEFDTLEELRAFDTSYQVKSGSVIMQTIAEQLNCSENDITQIAPISGGLTNKNFRFVCRGKTYVYRHPGDGTKELIDRKNEKKSTLLANTVGIDAELIYFDEETGTKITAYIENAETMSKDSLQKSENIEKMACVFRKLHNCGIDTGVVFDVFEIAEGYESYIRNNNISLFEDYKNVKEVVEKLKKDIENSGRKKVPCHNDALCENWIRGNEKMYLIDWEYAGMNDFMWDLADVCLEADFSPEQEEQLLYCYFGRKPDVSERYFFGVNKVLIDYLWSLWGKTRVPHQGLEMEQYAQERYVRLKENLKNDVCNARFVKVEIV